MEYILFYEKHLPAITALVKNKSIERICVQNTLLGDLEKALQAEGLTFTGGPLSEMHRNDDYIHVHINWPDKAKCPGYNFG